MAQLTSDKKAPIIPAIIVVLVILVIAALGYVVYTLYFQPEEDVNPPGNPLDTSALENESLSLIQYEPAELPEVDETLVGRDDPFAPF